MICIRIDKAAVVAGLALGAIAILPSIAVAATPVPTGVVAQINATRVAGAVVVPADLTWG